MAGQWPWAREEGSGATTGGGTGGEPSAHVAEFHDTGVLTKPTHQRTGGDDG